jgi:hypothetical protein
MGNTMTNITIPADKTIKWLFGAIVALGVLVWGDLRLQSMKATEAAATAADAARNAASESTKTLNAIKGAVDDQDRRLTSLERAVFGGFIPQNEGSGRFAPPAQLVDSKDKDGIPRAPVEAPEPPSKPQPAPRDDPGDKGPGGEEIIEIEE